MCRIDDCERFEVSTTVQVKARKPHTCGECRRTISVGETYTKDTGLHEGYWSAFKTCGHCLIGRQWLVKNCGGFVYEQVADEVEEHAHEYPPIAPGLLRVHRGMSRQWKRGDRLMNIPRMPRSIQSVVMSS